jgi:hypothetical protein
MTRTAGSECHSDFVLEAGLVMVTAVTLPVVSSGVVDGGRGRGGHDARHGKDRGGDDDRS